MTDSIEKSAVNSKQIGGDHYKKRDYEHWDFVIDIDLHYILACTVKYVARWRDKNGVEDLEKSIHYLEKAMEKEVLPPTADIYDKVVEYIGPLDIADGIIIMLVTINQYEDAITAINELIDETNEINFAEKMSQLTPLDRLHANMEDWTTTPPLPTTDDGDPWGVAPPLAKANEATETLLKWAKNNHKAMSEMDQESGAPTDDQLASNYADFMNEQFSENWENAYMFKFTQLVNPGE